MATKPVKAKASTVTPLLEFTASSDFRFQQHNSSPLALQAGKRGERYYTTSQQFVNQALLPNPAQFRILKTSTNLPCLTREKWAETDFSNKRVLFLLPSQALGNNVATLLFLHAFAEGFGPRKIGVFCARSTADIYLQTELAQVYPLWVSRKDLKRWDHVIDLGHLESRRNIDLWPVDMEADLLEAFALRPSARFTPAARSISGLEKPKIGILPLASSPLRTIPAAATLALADALRGQGDVTLCLNRDQHQGVLYARELAGKLPPGVTVIDRFDSIGALLESIKGLDYAVLADSGPAHMTKLFATPGTAIYSSAPGDVLQGRFENLARWTVPFKGPYCEAPCGLAKLRQTVDGRIGCIGSLEVPLEALPTSPTRQDPGLVARLMREPVPCIRLMADDPAPLVEFVLSDLKARLRAISDRLGP